MAGMVGFEPLRPGEEGLPDVRMEFEERGLVDLVRPIGSVDYPQIPAARRQLDNRARMGRVRMVLDLSRCVFLSSAAIGMLLKKTNDLKAAGGGLALAEVPHGVLTVLQILGVDKLMRIYPTAEEALRSF